MHPVQLAGYFVSSARGIHFQKLEADAGQDDFRYQKSIVWTAPFWPYVEY